MDFKILRKANKTPPSSQRKIHNIEDAVRDDGENLSCSMKTSLEEKQLEEYISEVSLSEVDASVELMMERYLELKIPKSYTVKFNFTPEK